jgi:hypothetical protein
MPVRITWISKAHGDREDPHVAISDLGWVEDGTNKLGRTNRIEMHDWVKRGGRAYVRIYNAKPASASRLAHVMNA